MTVEAALITAGAILVVTISGLIIFVSLRQQKAKEEELQRAASARGWKFETANERGYRVHRWTGTTDGVSWVAESLKPTAGGDKQRRRRHIARWHGNWSPGINGAIVAMGLPRSKEKLGKSIADGDGFFAHLARKAAGFAFDKALDVYFGQEAGTQVDAGTMRRVDTTIPGFIVMADQKDEGMRILQQGLENALRTAADDKSSVLSDKNRPWILLRPKAVSLARMKLFRDINELEEFVRAGVALTRIFTFGRRSPS